jgi:hypothetical protein
VPIFFLRTGVRVSIRGAAMALLVSAKTLLEELKA